MSAFSNSVFQFTGYSAGIYPFDNIDALRRVISTTIADKAHAIVDGGIVPADGAGGFYVWSATSTDTDNGSSVICPNDLGPTEPGRWQLVSLTGSVGIKYAEIDTNGHLQITRPDDTIIDCGLAVGPQGYTGAIGPTGKAATVTIGTVATGDPGSAVAITNSGTSSDAVLDIAIPRGDKGETGSKGSAATVAIGTVTTGAAGSAASVTNNGTATNAILDVVIPRGDTGSTGPQGDRGDVGPSPTIAIGTVVSGDAAAVTNTGTPTAAVLNITLPKGDKGDQGIQGIQGVRGQDGSTDAQTLAGQAPSYYTDIPSRLGYIPFSAAGGTVGGDTKVIGSVSTEANGPQFILSNAGTGDSALVFNRNGITRWNIGDSQTNQLLYVNRFDANGGYQETPFEIRLSDGYVVTNNQSISNSLGVQGSATFSGQSTFNGTILAGANNGGRASIKIGDDAWIGDGNLPNGLAIRGNSDANQGYVSFGQSNLQLGMSGNDSYLRWNADFIVNAWLRVNGDGGLYWESHGNGLQAANNGSASYGNVSIYGSGNNGWSGYAINNDMIFMNGNGGGQRGIYSPNHGGWLVSYDDSGNATFPQNITAFSDERLKQNIRTIDDPWTIICGMNGIRYERDGRTRVGLGAQTTRKVLPEVVFEADDLTGTLSVNYGDVVGPIIEALKDAHRRIEELENKLNGN